MLCSGTKAKVDEYIDGVLSGAIVTGRLTQLAVQRHVDDLSRQSTSDFPYHFSERHAEVACEFFPRVLRHSIGDFVGLPFELEPWQAFGVWCLFGWLRDADESRRFRRFYDSQGRKNGKTTRAAGLALYLAAFDIHPVTRKPESVAEVILAATKKEQVDKVMFAEIERMRISSNALAKRSAIRYRTLSFSHNKGSIRCVGTDRPYDGLNPHAVLLDELHEWRPEHGKFWDSMQTGSGSRMQPIIGSLTTAGADTSEIWRHEYEYARGVIEGQFKADTYFGYIFEADRDDDPFDPVVWGKANPNLGVSCRESYLREQPKDFEHQILQFRRYHLNQMTGKMNAAFNIRHWDSLEGELSDWSEADAIGGGVDMGGEDDLAAVAFVARFDTGEEVEGEPIYRYEVRSQCYISEDSRRDLTKQPFYEWCYHDYIKKTNQINAFILHELKSTATGYNVHQVAYDQYNARFIGEDLERNGIRCGKAKQSTYWFNEPIREFFKILKNNRLTHDGNPVLRWCVQNAVLKEDEQGKYMFDKGASSEKIDAVIAMVMAFRMASTAPARPIGRLYI